MTAKTLNELDEVVDQLKTDVFTSLTNIQLLNDLNVLIEEQNRVVMVNPVLFKSMLREFQLSFSIKLERIVEDGKEKANINHVSELVKYFQRSVKDESKKANIQKALTLIEEVKNSDTVKHNREFRNKVYAHMAKNQRGLTGLVIRYDAYKGTYEKLGEALNLISGAFFDKGTVMRIVGDDRTVEHFRGLEQAEAAMMYIERYEGSDHPALTHIGKLKKQTKD